MRALDDVVRAGKVLYLGVSNWPAWLVVKANEFARLHGLSPFVVYEGRWNAANREIEREVLPMCKAEGMGITVWNALGGGKFRIDGGTDEVSRKWSAMHDEASLEEHRKFAVVMDKIGKTKGSDATGVALRYVMLKVCIIILLNFDGVADACLGSICLSNHRRAQGRAFAAQHCSSQY